MERVLKLEFYRMTKKEGAVYLGEFEFTIGDIHERN